MTWKLPFLAAAIVLAMGCPPRLFAQDKAAETQNQQEQEAPAKPASPQPENGGQKQDGERANDQTVVIGYGFGQHLFDTPHDASYGSAGFTVISTLVEQVYGEWYLLDRFGIGLRYIYFSNKVTASSSVSFGPVSASATTEVELNVTTLLGTVHWVPLGGRRYGRLMVLAGAGPTSYDFTETNTPGGSSHYSTSGTSALAGIYVDWGADGFGARFGTQYLSSNLGTINGTPVDISARETLLDFRWAF